jgi:hypothetical protein
MCTFLDAQFGLVENPGCETVSTFPCETDRQELWDGAIPFDFLNDVSADCRFGKWAVPPISNSMTSVGVIQWNTDVGLMTLQLFGCALEGNLDGPLPFALIPPPFTSLHFTTADLKALEDLYVASVNQMLSDNASPTLTTSQTTAVRAQLDSAASRVAGVTTSSHLSFSTCPVDAGAQ